MNYEKDVAIDENALDIECLEQPSLVFQYSKWSAKCELEVDKASESMNIIKAELDQKIRENPDDYGVSKVTENAITNAIISHPKYQNAKADYLDKKYEAGMAKAAVYALNDKRTSLELLVKLHGQNYFAGPSIPRDLSREWTKKEEQRRVNASIKISTRLDSDDDPDDAPKKPKKMVRKFTNK